MKKKIISILAFIAIIIAAAIGGGVGKEIGREVGNAAFPKAEPNKQQIENALIKGFNQAADQANKRGPVMVDKDTSWDRTTVGPRAQINYFYSLPKYSSKDIDKSILLSNAQAALKKSVCTNTDMRSSLKLGATYAYVYSGNDGTEIARVEINNSHCAHP